MREQSQHAADSTEVLKDLHGIADRGPNRAAPLLRTPGDADAADNDVCRTTARGLPSNAWWTRNSSAAYGWAASSDPDPVVEHQIGDLT
jgi:hypothetical protein